MNSVLLWLGGLLVAVLALLFAVPYAIDWNAYRGVFEEEASRVLGRDVRVGGRVDLRLLPSPYVRFEHVRLSDSTAVLGEPFFRAQSFTLWLATPPLLRGAIEVKQIELEGPVLRLAVDERGRGNWESLTVDPAAASYMPSDVVLQNVQVRNGTISIKPAGLPSPLQVNGIDGVISAGSLSGPYRFAGTVEWHGKRQELRLATASQAAETSTRLKATIRDPDGGSSYTLDGSLSDLTARAKLAGELTARISLGQSAARPPSAGGATLIAPAPGPSPSSPPSSPLGADVRASTGEQPPGRQKGRAHTAASFDLKSKVDLDIKQLVLQDIAVAFEHNGRPQLLSGQAVADWRDGMTVRAKLASRWLDLDSILPAGGSAGQIDGTEGRMLDPLAAAHGLISRLGALLPATGNSLAIIDVDQVNLGGDAVSGVHLALARSGGLTSIGEFRAQLPGNTHLELRGTLGAAAGGGGGGASSAANQDAANGTPTAGAVQTGNSRTFEGDLLIHGVSYQRFLEWAVGNRRFGTVTAAGATGVAPAETRLALPRSGDGRFSLATVLRVQPTRVVLKSADLEFGSTQLSGDLDWRWDGVRRTQIRIDGSSIDLSALAPGLLGLFKKPDDRTATASGSTAPAPSTDAAARRPMVQRSAPSPLTTLADRARQLSGLFGTVEMNARTLHVTDGTTTLHDVEAVLAFEAASATFERLKFSTPEGVGIEVQGKLTALAGKPQGVLRGWLSSRDSRGTASLVDALPIGRGPLAPQWARRVARLDLGYQLRFGGANPDRLEIEARGSVDEGRLSLSAALDGGLEGWRQAPVEFAVQFDHADLPAALFRFASPTASPTTVASAAAPVDAAAPIPTGTGTLTIRATGTTPSPLVTLARIDTPGLRATYTGNIGLGADSVVDMTGKLVVKAGAANELLRYIGVSGVSLATDAGLSGVLDVSRTKAATVLTSRAVTLGTTRIGGQVRLATAGPRLEVDARLGAERAAIPELLRLVLDGGATRQAIPSASAVVGGRPDAAAVPRASPWSDAPFDFSLLDTVVGNVTLSTPELTLTDGLIVRRAELQLALRPGEIKLERLTGSVLDGRLSVQSTILRTPAGAEVAITGSVTAAKLAMLAVPTSRGRPVGSADIRIDVSGRAQSPLAVISALKGRGEIALRGVTITGLGADTVDLAAAELIEGNEPITPQRLEQAVARQLAAGQLALGTRKLAVDVVDGALRIEAFQIDGARARLTNTTTVDLGSLQLDSEWQLAPQKPLVIGSKGQEKAPLPPLTAVWAGSLASVGSTAPRIAVAALERELMVRKMERDVERLEDLRRQDEERVRLETERRRRLEEETRRGLLPGVGQPPRAGVPVIQAPFSLRDGVTTGNPGGAGSPGIAPPGIAPPGIAPPGIAPSGDAPSGARALSPPSGATGQSAGSSAGSSTTNAPSDVPASVPRRAPARRAQPYVRPGQFQPFSEN